MFHRDKPDLCQQMKRSKQKSMQAATNSPKLGPSGNGGRRSRSDSLASQASHTTAPSPGGLTPGGHSSTGMTPLLTNLSVGGGGSPPTISLDGPSPRIGNATTTTTTYHTSFRSGQDGAPPTGLGVLMSSNNTGGGILHHQHHSHERSYTPEQRKLMQRDAQDRERQAKALAAAGMVAEQAQAGLHPPPTLGNPTLGHAAAANPGPLHVTSTNPGGNDVSAWSNLETTNGGGVTEGEALTLEEMESDFAQLFDPNVEWDNMHTEGSGWPQMMEGNGGGGDLQDAKTG